MTTLSLGALGISFKRLYQGSPLAISAPAFTYPSLSTTGGSIAASTTRYYVVTAVVNGQETLPSAETSVTTASGTSTNTITLGATFVPGATSYKWYGSATSGTEVLLGTTSTPTFTDTGAAGSGAFPTTTTLVETIATPGLYTPPVGKVALVRSITVSNTSTASGQVYVSHVPVGNSGGAGNRLLAGVPVKPDSVGGGPLEYGCFQVLGAGDFLTGALTVAGMVLTINGLELPA